MEFAFINSVPFVLAAVIALPQSRYIPRNVQTWASAGIMGALFVMLLGYLPAIEQAPIEQSISWLPEWDLNLTFYLDGLSLIFGLIVTGIGALILIYSGYYFDDAETQTRFNKWMLAFAGAMLGVVISGNLITLFIMWELTSITSFMLIGFKGDKSEEARYGAMQALIITGGGGLAMLVGVVLLGAAAGQIDIAHHVSSGLPFNANIASILATEGLTQHPWYPVFTLLLMIGAFTKSAQFPFHFWLPGAMQAPTPASAYLHSATMVKAGIYLLLRFYPPLHESDFWMQSLVTIGLLTFFIGAFFAIKQRDLKALLAYATVSKLGALVALIGLPHYEGIKAALVGILAHAMYKGALFLVAGTIDHTTGTRIIDKLGGLRKHMPILTVITVISGLSMAGVPIFFGFVAKETLLDAFHHAGVDTIMMIAAIAASVFTAAAAYIFIWDVFFREPTEEIHLHMPPLPIDIGPTVLAAGSALFGLLIGIVIQPLVDPAVPKDVKLYLFPSEITQEFLTVFGMSLFAIFTGWLVFLTRNWWIALPIPIPRGTKIYAATLGLLDRIGYILIHLQAGKLRYYMVIILGTIVVIILGSGLLTDLARGQTIVPESLHVTTNDILVAILLILMIAGTVASILFKRHLLAAIALGVAGYVVGVIFLIEPAPDVALVQFLVETLATVLIMIMISRISVPQRERIIQQLWWSGRKETNGTTRKSPRPGILRDILISTAFGLSVFVFAAVAIINRPSRDTIADWYVEHTYKELGIQDIVAGILTDFRGTDTLFEITVFMTAALGIVTLLAIGRGSPDQPESRTLRSDTLIPRRVKTLDIRDTSLGEVVDSTRLATPFTRMAAAILLPFALLVSISHILYGGDAPGDGFTAGVVSGLGVALLYIVYGYRETRRRLRRLRPGILVRIGLSLATINALLPLLWGESFLQYNELEGFKAPAGLHLGSTLLFEIGIAITIFGSVTMILEAIAHPKEIKTIDTPELETEQA